ncbi:metal-sensing transcriptional repressor [Clostridium ihumii]|uniref:metal-sensing transcriptional repressor n=1 Tax=Clostridium ihumii TaxID=1470356 RepID=UPI00058AD651|nr:metal-sensing transcriptional repressor [Clostridium ihumii]
MNEEKKNAIKYLKIARGQIDGIIKMIEDERYCMDISNQIIASQSILKKANSEIIKQHLSHCVKNSCCHDDIDEKLEEINTLIDKLMK